MIFAYLKKKKKSSKRFFLIFQIYKYLQTNLKFITLYNPTLPTVTRIIDLSPYDDM